METTILLSTEVACALITLGGVIFANLSSRWIAKETAIRETEKLKQTWQHDSEMAFERAFHDMTEAVSVYILNSCISNQETARVKTAIMLTFAEGDLADKIDSLYFCLKHRPAPDAEDKLAEVIRCRRSQRTSPKRRTWFSFFR